MCSCSDTSQVCMEPLQSGASDRAGGSWHELEITGESRVACILAAAPAKSLQSCPTLCDAIDCSPPGSAIPRILQERTLEWVAISFSNAWKWKVEVKSLSRVRPLETPWTAAYQAPLSMGFSRQEYWSGVPLPSPACICERHWKSGGRMEDGTDSERLLWGADQSHAVKGDWELASRWGTMWEQRTLWTQETTCTRTLNGAQCDQSFGVWVVGRDCSAGSGQRAHVHHTGF